MITLESAPQKQTVLLVRDNVVRMELRDKGIKCLIVWECTAKRIKRNQVDCEKYLQFVEDFFKTKELLLEMRAHWSKICQ